MKILVTGAKGQLGSELNYLASSYRYNFEFIDREELDLADEERIIPFLENSNPDFIINCAAYTAVDKAEDEPELAKAINITATQKITNYCHNHKKRLIHISTDYVFDGNFEEPINEVAKPNPQSVYGYTKWKGEQVIIDSLNDAYIIRTAWVYSSFGNNFVKTMLRLGSEKKEIKVIVDQIGSPTYARDLAAAILEIIGQIEQENDQPGIYHYSNEGSCSWAEFANEVMRIGKLNCNVKPITTSEYPTKAERPKYSVLDKSKIKSNLPTVSLNDWRLSLKECMKV